MHILFVISSLNAGGAERVLITLANTWALDQHKISIVTFDPISRPSFYTLNPLIQVLNLDQNSNEVQPFWIKLRNFIYRALSLRKILKICVPDVVISFMDITNITTLLAVKNLNIPVIVSERTDPYFYQIPMFYRILRKFTYGWANFVVVQTQTVKTFFKNLNQQKIVVISNPILKCSKPQTTYTHKMKHIISVGRLEKEKDHASLISAFAEIALRYADLTLTIYGEGTERQTLESQIKDLNLQNKIFLPGVKKDISPYLNQADLFVFPSLFEGFPNALAEAMSAGLPVIASNCNGNVDLIQDRINGRLFEKGNVQQLSHIIRELIEQPSERTRFGQNAMKVSDDFSLEKIIHQWEEIIFRK